MNELGTRVAVGLCLLIFGAIFTLYVDIDVSENVEAAAEVHKRILDCFVPDWGADSALVCDIESRP